MNESLDFIDHVLGALAVHVLLIFEHLVDALFLLVTSAIFFARLQFRLFGKVLSRHFLNIVLRVKVILLFERDLVLRVDVQLEFPVSYGWLRVGKLGQRLSIDLIVIFLTDGIIFEGFQDIEVFIVKGQIQSPTNIRLYLLRVI